MRCMTPCFEKFKYFTIILSKYFFSSKLALSGILQPHPFSGGGWTLVVSVSSTSTDHFQEGAINCLNSVLCVPFNERDVSAHKLSDKDIHELVAPEGEIKREVNIIVYIYDRCSK